MKSPKYLIWIGVAAAAGAAMGMLADRKDPARGGILGAAAGLVTASFATAVGDRVSSRRRVPLYSSSSSLYDDTDSA